MNPKPQILYTSPITTRSGYGDKARDFAKYIFSRYEDSTINLLSTRWGGCSLDGIENDTLDNEQIYTHLINTPPPNLPDISFHLTMPNEFRTFGKVNIGLTAGVEADRCAESFIRGCNLMDLVLVPTTFAKDTLMSTTYEGLTCDTPIEVVFEGYANDIITTTEDSLTTNVLNQIPEDFCFLSVGQWSTTHDRKNIEGLLKTFNDTFKNSELSPALVLKIHGTSHCVQDEMSIRERIYKIIPESKRTAPIYILYGNVTQQEMASMYQHPKIKCMVSFTRGEGFGRPLLEASVNGLPIIASKWSGHLDFLNKKYCKLLPGTMIPVTGLEGLAAKVATWFDVDTNYASKELEDMVLRYEIHKKRATKLQQINTEKYSLTQMFSEYDNAITNYI